MNDRREDEDYSPAFALPREPRVWSRGQRRILTVLVVVTLVALGAYVVASALASQAEDPALEQPAGAPGPAAEG